MNKVESFLKENKISYLLHIHKAVYTTSEAEKFCQSVKGMHCKNLFLYEKRSNRYFLVILPAFKNVDFKKLFSELCCKRLQFASSVLLEEKLNLQAGSVSLFGLLNDENDEVELIIDEDVYNSDVVSFHPNINTATIELEKDMFYQVLGLLKKNHKIIKL